MHDPLSLIKYLSHFSYLGFFVYFCFFGYLIPIPEEIILVVLGYLAGIGRFNPWLVFFSVFIGMMTHDNVFYWLCYKESKYLLHFKAKVKPEIWDKYKQLMLRNLGKTLILLRFFIGFRFLGSAIAGSLQVRWRRFMAYDLPIVAAYVWAFVSLGLYFRRRYLLAISLVEQLRSFILVIILISLVIFVFRKFLWKANGKEDH